MSPADGTLDFGDMSVATIPDENADGKGTCPDCGKTLTITAAGNLRAHKCVNEIDSSDKAKAPRQRKGKAPKKVRALGVAALASGVEWGSSNVVARATDLRPQQVAPVVDMGDDADIMVGPLVEFLWPHIPKGGQRIISDLADESDLLLSGMAWWEWGKRVKSFIDQHNEAASSMHKAAQEGTQNGPIFGTPEGGGRPSATLGLVPFTPDAASGEAL